MMLCCLFFPQAPNRGAAAVVACRFDFLIRILVSYFACFDLNQLCWAKRVGDDLDFAAVLCYFWVTIALRLSCEMWLAYRLY